MNRLANESSPYLLQHADNPVDWYPWSDEAFEAARQRNVPVILSVGYSSCHWCHVMAHESFEDAETATLMNENFVSIKVDREERPDVDAIYMDATQALSGQGGWPMTVFLTPDQEPFFAGTYFPRIQQGHSPAFRDVLKAIADTWSDRQDELVNQARDIANSIKNHAELAGFESSDKRLSDNIDKFVVSLLADADAEWGGFGRAPKFPQTNALRFLLASADPDAISFSITSLDAMAAGGIYDQIGGGFARYSTDSFWMVPHFEKMLYDQAQAIDAYLDAWLATGEDRHLQIATETIEYLIRDMKSPEGAFYSAEDADSEGEEGAFYVWRIEEIEETCGTDAADAIEWYGATKAGNFEARNILHRPTRGEIKRPQSIERARNALLDARSKRERPGLDDKVLLEWNAMLIASIARAAFATDNDRWSTIALGAAQFLQESLHDGRDWLRSWHRDGSHKTVAFAQDIAQLVEAFTRLYELTGTAKWLEAARSAADYLIDNYSTDDSPLFTTSNTNGEQLIANAREVFDGASASANSQAAYSLIRLGSLSADSKYSDRSHAILKFLANAIDSHPSAFSKYLSAVLLSSGVTEVVLPGWDDELTNVVREQFLPTAVVARGETINNELWSGRSEGNAYVCRDRVCDLPAQSAAELKSQLASFN